MIENQQVYVSYVADGQQREWEFPYQYNSTDSIKLYIEHDGELKEVEDAYYKFDEITKKVTYPINPNADAVAAGDTVLVWRTTTVTQEEDSSIANFKSNDIERMVDKLTMICQELTDKMGRVIGFNPTEYYSTDATSYIRQIQAGVDTASAAAASASNSAEIALDAQTQAETTMERAKTVQEELNIVSADTQTTVDRTEAALTKLESWLITTEALADSSATFYVVGTPKDDYTGSNTTFPVPNDFLLNSLVFVNGQYKLDNLEYERDEENSRYIFKFALREGDHVAIIPFVVFAKIDDTNVIAEAITAHNTNAAAHAQLRNTFTITRNGTTVGTFTAMNGTSSAANIEVPTKADQIDGVTIDTNQTIEGVKTFTEITYGKTPSDVAIGNELVTAAWARKNAGGGGSGGNSASLPIFSYEWYDHLNDDANWLRSDLNTWISGDVYTSAYEHLVKDLETATNQIENIGGTVITYYRATDAHKIILPDMESSAESIFQNTNKSWYYLLDTTNKRFKLPREAWQSSDTQELEQHRYLYFYLGGKIVDASEIDVGTMLDALAGKVDVPSITNSGTITGTVALNTNTIYTVTISGDVTFSLPTVDTANYNQIKVMAHVTVSNANINWGTTHYFKNTVPDVGAGYYDFYFDYDNNLEDWVVGIIYKG